MSVSLAVTPTLNLTLTRSLTRSLTLCLESALAQQTSSIVTIAQIPTQTRTMIATLNINHGHV